MENCYHCGLEIPPNTDFKVEINGENRLMCCAGCAAVAQMIVAGGLADYYQKRDALPNSPREAKPAVLEELALFDHQNFQKNFVQQKAENLLEASLLLEGMTCAACLWLIERHLMNQKGVVSVEINYATRRARIAWDLTKTKLSQILESVAQIGYRAYPYDAAKNEALNKKERKDALWRLWVAGFGMMQVMMYAFPIYIADGDMSPEIENLMRWAGCLLTLPVIFYSAAPFFKNAYRDLKIRHLGMDVPVALGIGVAFSASIYALLTQTGEVYFDSVTMFVFFLLAGRFVEMTARQKAMAGSESLARLVPNFAHRLQKNGQIEECLVADLNVGDFVLIKPGEIIPADGVVEEGPSAVDERLLTGESRAIPKSSGDNLTGGALNGESALKMRVLALGENTKLSAIIRLMERSSSDKPKIVVLSDKIAAYFVAAVLILALSVATYWLAHDSSKALWITVSVLVVTCPCALSLATPVALTVATGALAKDGILTTHGHAIETLARATHFVFDKTGTLTRGELALQKIIVLKDIGESDALKIAASLEVASEHPLSRAILAKANAYFENFMALTVENFQNQAGFGVSGEIDGKKYVLGRLNLNDFKKSKRLKPFVEAGDTLIVLKRDETPLAVFALSDTLRDDAPALINALKEAGKTVVLLTGDSDSVAQKMGERLGFDKTAVFSEQSPEGKHKVVENLQKMGAVVAMFGDGINDAPVLAQAQVSIVMGSGSELARTQADLILLNSKLFSVYRGILRSRRTLKTISQNLAWAVCYNIVALPLAMAGYVTPWMAGIGMSASSLMVVLNSLRIERKI